MIFFVLNSHETNETKDATSIADGIYMVLLLSFGQCVCLCVRQIFR